MEEQVREEAVGVGPGVDAGNVSPDAPLAGERGAADQGAIVVIERRGPGQPQRRAVTVRAVRNQKESRIADPPYDVVSEKGDVAHVERNGAPRVLAHVNLVGDTTTVAFQLNGDLVHEPFDLLAQKRGRVGLVGRDCATAGEADRAAHRTKAKIGRVTEASHGRGCDPAG